MDYYQNHMAQRPQIERIISRSYSSDPNDNRITVIIEGVVYQGNIVCLLRDFYDPMKLYWKVRYVNTNADTRYLSIPIQPLTPTGESSYLCILDGKFEEYDHVTPPSE